MSRYFPLHLILLILAWAPPCQAEIYKFVDDNGHVTYTNMPRPGAKKLDLGPLPGKSVGDSPSLGNRAEKKRSASSNPTPSSFPRVDVGTQRKRDDMRRQLLVEELNSEQRNLTAARSEFSSNRGRADSNRLAEAVRLHEKNIEMLNKELSHIR